MTTTNLNTSPSALHLFIEAALADAFFKVMEGIWCRTTDDLLKAIHDENLYPSKWGTLEERRFDRKHPYYEACDKARMLCGKVGRFCQENSLEPSTSRLFDSLHFKDHLMEVYEHGRLVECAVLTPKVIHDAVERRNTLIWQDWTITAGRRDFSTDAYGLDQYIRPLRAQRIGSTEHIELWMPGQAHARAKLAYSLITGTDFIGDDELGPDHPHMLEFA